MTADWLLRFAITPALSLLPAKMDTPAARAEMLAIALQESRIQYRVQIGGPAHGLWQFERGGGVHGVLTHPATKPCIQSVLTALNYEPDSPAAVCYDAIQDNDTLAAAFARLLLWTLPWPLPMRSAPEDGWRQYIAAWRPGKPHRATWDAFYKQAWGVVSAD